MVKKESNKVVVNLNGKPISIKVSKLATEGVQGTGSVNDLLFRLERRKVKRIKRVEAIEENNVFL